MVEAERRARLGGVAARGEADERGDAIPLLHGALVARVRLKQE